MNTFSPSPDPLHAAAGCSLQPALRPMLSLSANLLIGRDACRSYRAKIELLANVGAPQATLKNGAKIKTLTGKRLPSTTSFISNNTHGAMLFTKPGGSLLVEEMRKDILDGFLSIERRSVYFGVKQ